MDFNDRETIQRWVSAKYGKLFNSQLDGKFVCWTSTLRDLTKLPAIATGTDVDIDAEVNVDVHDPGHGRVANRCDFVDDRRRRICRYVSKARKSVLGHVESAIYMSVCRRRASSHKKPPKKYPRGAVKERVSWDYVPEQNDSVQIRVVK